MGTVGTTQRRRPEVSDRTIRFGKSPVSQFPQRAVIKPQSIPKYLPGRPKMTRSAPGLPRWAGRRNARFSGGRVFAGFAVLLERAAILLIGQALTGCAPRGAEVRAKTPVSFLWTASPISAPAVHDFPSHQPASSGHWGGGLARTASFLKFWFPKRLHSDRP